MKCCRYKPMWLPLNLSLKHVAMTYTFVLAVHNGLIAKHDVFDQKVTFVTPAHSAVTLHVNYINNVSGDDLLKTIFSTFEWCAYKGY